MPDDPLAESEPRRDGVHSVDLPDDFPVVLHGNYVQRDRPILRLHLHNVLEVGYCHEGAGIFVVEKKVMPFRAGDVSVINDGEMHLCRSAEGLESRWTWIHVDPPRLVDAGPAEARFLRIAPLGGPDFANILPRTRFPWICDLVRVVMRELEEGRAGHQSAVRGLVWALMVRLHRLAGKGAKPASLRKQEIARRIAPALEHVAWHFAEPVRVEELGKLCHTSVTNLRRLFQDAVGMPPQDYLTHLRVQMGASLLRSTDRPVQEVAAAVGYPSLSSFNRHFKRATQVTPRQYRRTESAGR